MHEEGRWNHRRLQPGRPRVTVNQVTAQEEALWSEAQREVQASVSGDANQVDWPIQADLWYCGSWKNEAKEFFALLQRGVSDVRTLRADIGINVSEMDDLKRWIVLKPSLESRIRRMIDHRERMLDEFNRLVAESCAARARPQTAATD